MSEVIIRLKNKQILHGILNIPNNAHGIVIFVHGSGSGRFSPRNQFVANHFVKSGIATLLLDLLTKEEEIIDDQTRELRFNISFLAKRVVEVTEWVKENPETKNFKIGYFGASTGAAAALVAAHTEQDISAIVSRGGRPDLAKEVLPFIKAPSLFIVGGYDYEVIELNQFAFNLLKCVKKMEIVPKATHLFEEEGALEEVVTSSCEWFRKFLI